VTRVSDTTSGAPGALRRALPFFICALVCVIVGGLLSAAAAYIITQKIAWAVAYIVLVAGVAQAGLGAALGWLAQRARPAVVWAAFVLWNLGNIGVVAGQLSGALAATMAGGALLVVALVLTIIASRRGAPTHLLLLWGFRVLVVVLAVSIPTGLVLAALGR